MGQLRTQFAKRLKMLRLTKGLTQAELAKAAKLSTSFVSNLERGINAPSFENLEGIAEALGITVKDLFDFEN